MGQMEEELGRKVEMGNGRGEEGGQGDDRQRNKGSCQVSAAREDKGLQCHLIGVPGVSMVIPCARF